MALVYQGKLNFREYAIDENIVIILPNGRTHGGKAVACWQWTKDGSGKLKTNQHYEGNIDSLEAAADGSSTIIMFAHQFFIVCGKVSSNGFTMELTLAHDSEKSELITLHLVYAG